MRTPKGQSAGKIDRIMLLAMWTKFLRSKRDGDLNNNSKIASQEIISAGMGKPELPINKYTSMFMKDYWEKISSSAIDYGDPQGDLEPRKLMAEAMSRWYETYVDPNNILFTVGGAGALQGIFATLKTLHQETTPNFRIITPFPYYTLYGDYDNHLHPIDVMKNPGYKLTAESLQVSINQAYDLAIEDHGYPKVILLCDPNNPLSTVLGKKELEKIADILRKYPDIHIILDEAYAEMCLDGKKHISLLTVAPDLKDRIIIMRSATKALSAAGERMAITIAFNEKIMAMLLQKNISNYGHAPRSLQMAYATTMSKFTSEEQKNIVDFYRPKLEYVKRRLIEMGANMPDPHYNPEGTFYILGDFSDLLGETLPESSSCALNKKGKISTDEDITYYLLFKDSLMIAPLSYFGMPKNKGYMRITCSGNDNEVKELMNRLENRLTIARANKKDAYLNEIHEKLSILINFNKELHHDILDEINDIIDPNKTSSIDIKKQNEKLGHALSAVELFINQSTTAGKEKAATVIQANFRGYLARKETKLKINAQNVEWYQYVDQIAPNPSKIRSDLMNFSLTQRLEFTPWKKHISNLNNQSISAYFFMQVLLSHKMKIVGSLLLLAILSLSISTTAALALSGITAGVGIGLVGFGIFYKKERHDPSIAPLHDPALTTL